MTTTTEQMGPVPPGANMEVLGDAGIRARWSERGDDGHVQTFSVLVERLDFGQFLDTDDYPLVAPERVEPSAPSETEPDSAFASREEARLALLDILFDEYVTFTHTEEQRETFARICTLLDPSEEV